MKRLWNYFYPPVLEYHPAIMLLNAQNHIGERIYATACFRAEGTIPREDREAMAILEKALKECM